MDPNATTISSIWDSLTSVVGTGLIAGTANVVDNALAVSQPASTAANPVATAAPASSGSTMMIAMIVLAALAWAALRK